MKTTGQSPVRLESFRWEKPGIATIVYVQLVAHGGAPAGIPSPESPVAVKYQGYSMRNVGSHMEFRWFFRGAEDMPRSATDTSPGGLHSEQWSMDISLLQVPITSHPDIDDIMQDYGGVLRAGEVEFPPYVKGGTNPFYGVRDFFAPGLILRVQRVKPQKSGSNTGSVSQLDGLGYIEAPTGSAFGFVTGSTGGNRSPWLKTEYSFRAEGDQIVETEGWRYGGIGGRGGWLREIYRPRDSRF